ncbi:MAG: S9 family peptidase [Bacteroidota bacterium]|jgi:dipeptidyl aminopeptidase/acylaminoacyl peptidase
MKLLFTFLVAFLFTSLTYAQPKRAITFDDLINFGRVSDPQISPDGKTAAFVVTWQLKEENKSTSSIYLVNVTGGNVRQLTNAKGDNSSPRWLPDGESIAFISTRDGESQIWTIAVSGGEAKKVSHSATEASGLIVSPDGKWFAFSSDVYPDCLTEDCNAKRLEAVEKSKVKAKIFTTLPYRVWKSWKDGKRSHLFVMPSNGGKAIDVTPGEYDTPPIDLGGNWDYAFSPDSKEIAFTRNPDTLVAVSTNNEIYIVPVTGGTPKNISNNPANDSQPLYSPDGKYIAYRMMRQAGFEADRRELVLYERASGKLINLTEQFDYSVNDVVWSPDSKSLFFNADDKGNVSIFKVKVTDKKVTTILDKGFNTSLRLTSDGKTLVITQETVKTPTELFRMDIDGKNLKQITFINSEKASQLEMNSLENFWFEGAEGIRVQGFILKPPFFSSENKYPLIFLVHGGPQGQWGDDFHYRWNAQMFASHGYVAVMINPRGSTGYGQKFTDEISKDWGGKVYVDLMNGLDYVLKTYAFIDGNRTAAAGASYGGYMMNWILGHTDRFRCVVSHDGVFNPASAYGTTEELWFNEWEFGGTPYKNPELYKKWSPMEFAQNFKTPTLVIHGQQDYRLDVSEGFQLFTALQRQGVKSKMLYFPDEYHWVAKPQNAELWYKTVLDWIDENTK